MLPALLLLVRSQTILLSVLKRTPCSPVESIVSSSEFRVPGSERLSKRRVTGVAHSASSGTRNSEPETRNF